MPFRILYLEDRDANRIIETIHGGGWSGPDIEVVQEKKVENLAAQLKTGFDLLLADIGVPNKEFKDVNRLNDILAKVAEHAAEWRKVNPELGLASLPVIVYTSRTEEVAQCLNDHRHQLYDIWDKSTASPEYVAWRLGVVARDVERRRPGRVLQQAIGGLEQAASWHERVLYMLSQYRSGRSEIDQIERCGDFVGYIAAQIGCADGAEMWQALAEWELLDRAADRRVRGHARHSLHVFWLGYVLINEASLSEIWQAAWQRVLDLRPDPAVRTINWQIALNNVWFLASVFHDVGYAAQDGIRVVNAVDKVGSLLDLNLLTVKKEPTWGKYKETAEHVLGTFKNSDAHGYAKFRTEIKARFEKSVKDHTPDHGCMSAGRLAAAKPRTKQAKWYLAEAARAVALHSMMPDVDVPSAMSWDADPLGTLLLLLDQLQTWDRERPENLKSDWPERAELSAVRITPGTQPRVDLRINYLVRPHVEREGEVFNQVQQSLLKVLERLPIAAIRSMQPRLPFDFAVEFFLADTKIDEVVPSVI